MFYLNMTLLTNEDLVLVKHCFGVKKNNILHSLL